jgi:hypothetical protein
MLSSPDPLVPLPHPDAGRAVAAPRPPALLCFSPVPGATSTPAAPAARRPLQPLPRPLQHPLESPTPVDARLPSRSGVPNLRRPPQGRLLAASLRQIDRPAFLIGVLDVVVLCGGVLVDVVYT